MALVSHLGTLAENFKQDVPFLLVEHILHILTHTLLLSTMVLAACLVDILSLFSLRVYLHYYVPPSPTIRFGLTYKPCVGGTNMVQ